MASDFATLQKHASDFWLARGAVALAAALNLFLVNNLTLGPRWLAPALEIALLVPLSIATAWTQDRIREAKTHHHWNLIRRHRRVVRRFALLLTALVTVTNFIALGAVMQALLYNNAKSANGQTLLLDALNIWFTNIVVFALWFWNLDHGGPAMRGLATERNADFLFPQMVQAKEAAGEEEWTPGFIDYLYLSFTNATAFSPTDTMPLSASSKLLMMVEAAVSLLTVGLVAARAVNVLG